MNKSLLFVVLFIFTVQLKAQNNTNIPGWILDAKNYNSQQYALGFSDPDMDSTTALEQAKTRALVNYSIFNNSQYATLSSVSVANQQSNSFSANGIETILFSSILKGNFSLPDSLQIIKKTITKYHEYCVLIKPVTETASNSNTGNYTIIRRTAYQKENNQFLVVSDEIEFKIYINDTIKSNYVIKRIKNQYDIASFIWIDNVLNEVKIKNAFRMYSLAAENENPLYYSSLSSGLWAAFLYELSDKLSFQSVLNKNKANKLITSEIGNIQKHQQDNSLNSFILSSKKLETQSLKLAINELSVKNNYLHLKLKNEDHQTNDITSLFKKNRKTKKQLKKLKKENWIAIGFNELEDAFFRMKSYEQSNDYLSSSAELMTQGLGSGILKTMEISRSDIENQLNTKIQSLSQSGLASNKAFSVQNSKSVTNTKTNTIYPYFIFFRKMNKQFYQIRVVLFYEI